MNLKLTYIYHNCFVISDGNTNIIFDMGDSDFIPGTAEIKLDDIRSKKKNIYIFSHSHHDHFNYRICRDTQDTCILSDDIKCPAIHSDRHTIIREGDKHDINEDIRITNVYKSNDMGIALILEWHQKNIYFGGDLAEWAWDDLTESEEKLFIKHYNNILEELSHKKIDIAFTNADDRLKNLSGAGNFFEKVCPGILVPMHFFGNTDIFSKIESQLKIPPSRMFRYSHPGDSITI